MRLSMSGHDGEGGERDVVDGGHGHTTGAGLAGCAAVAVAGCVDTASGTVTDVEEFIQLLSCYGTYISSSDLRASES